MNTSSRTATIPATVLQKIVTPWLDSEVISLEIIGGGGNSQVYRVTAATGRKYALKVYFQHTTDPRDRLGTEFSGLRFLWENGVHCIPEPLYADQQKGAALYEYIEGQKIRPDEVTEAEIDTAVSFLEHLKELRHRPGSENLRPASEACFSVQTIEANIYSRLKRLADGSTQAELRASLVEFLDQQFRPALMEIISWGRESLHEMTLSFEAELSQAERTLSPSDFGFHNALRRANGQLVFLDFEYFGWDDPAKMVVDVLLHPGMNLSAVLKQRFGQGILHRFSDFPHLAQRVKLVYPLFGLKWCLILLNEFLPEQLLRRQFAATRLVSPREVQAKQLAKAKHLLQRLIGEYEHFPYF